MTQPLPKGQASEKRIVSVRVVNLGKDDDLIRPGVWKCGPLLFAPQPLVGVAPKLWHC